MYPSGSAPTAAPAKPAQLITRARSWLAPSAPAPAVKRSVSVVQLVCGEAVNTELLPILNCTVHPLLVSCCLVNPLSVYCVPGQSVRGWDSVTVRPGNAERKRAMVPLVPVTDETVMVGSNWLTNQPSVLLFGCMSSEGERTRLPLSLHAAAICSWVARVPERRKRDTGAAVAPLSTSEVVEAVTSDTTLEIALRTAETTGAASEDAGAASVTAKLSIAEARLSTAEDSTAALLPVGSVPLRPAVAAEEEIHVEATTGIVSTVYVVIITSLVMVENSVGLAHASVVCAVGPEGSVELPVGKGGRVAVMLPEPEAPVVKIKEEDRVRLNDPLRSPSLLVNSGPVEVEFKDTGGIVTDGGGAVVEFNGTDGVSTVILMLVVGEGMTIVMLLADDGGKMVERLPVGKEGTVDQLIDTSDVVEMLPVGVGSGAVVLSKGRVVGGIRVTLPLGSESVVFVVRVTIRVEADSDI